jgi:hypothetical protein
VNALAPYFARFRQLAAARIAGFRKRPPPRLRRTEVQLEFPWAGKR